ncbi:hypothetical protein LZ198_42705 [Myxococcus sp. K15C18031901]|uniref:hypothetical protein n=1 Tax=Myxococcus dinghuensis TaxID=2906761 RepID=UPI0020A7C1C8|nr:hypothetical protein [Myxococcus dinghuensis]MCP3105577.1 hypothetical protein [Myxococcus dinghuensis]
MFEVLRIPEGDAVVVTLDKRRPGALNDYGIFSEGPTRGVVRSGNDELPTGTTLEGRIWVRDGALMARYTQARYPNGSTYPVCIVIGENGWVQMGPGPKPGTVEFPLSAYGYVVKEWP